MRYIIPLLIVLCLSSCSEDNETVITPIDPTEVATTAARYSDDFEERSRAATEELRKYMELKDKFPGAAREALIRHAKIAFDDHELVEEWADIMMKSDIAGKMSLDDMIRFTEIRLQIEKDKKPRDLQRIKKIEEDLMNWKQKIAHGKDAVHIKFKIQIKGEE